MIETTHFWFVVVMMAIGTIAIRGSIIAISGRVKITDRTKEIFSFIPAAILPAFIAPAVFFHSGHVGIAWGKERLLILVLATGICYIFRSTLMTIAFGLIALYCMTHFL